MEYYHKPLYLRRTLEGIHYPISSSVIRNNDTERKSRDLEAGKHISFRMRRVSA